MRDNVNSTALSDLVAFLCRDNESFSKSIIQEIKQVQPITGIVVISPRGAAVLILMHSNLITLCFQQFSMFKMLYKNLA